MADALAMLDRGLPRNPDVRLVLRSNGKNAIRLSPLTALPEPPNLYETVFAQVKQAALA